MCGAVYAGERHDRWWLTGTQLWLAERAVHARAARCAAYERRSRRVRRAMLDEYADRYARYPNRRQRARPVAAVLQHVSRVDLAAPALRSPPICSTPPGGCARRPRHAFASGSSSRARRSSLVRRRRSRIVRSGTTPRCSPRRASLGESRSVAARDHCSPLGARSRSSRTGLLADGTLVRGRELSSLRAPRALVRRDDGGSGRRAEFPPRCSRAFSADSRRRFSPRFPISHFRRAAIRSTASRSASGASPSRASSDSRGATTRAAHRRARSAVRERHRRSATPAAGARRPSPSATSRRAR